MTIQSRLQEIRRIPEREQYEYFKRRRAEGYTCKEIALLYQGKYERKTTQRHVARVLEQYSILEGTAK